MPFPDQDSKLQPQEAQVVMKTGRIVSDGESESGCFWRGYEMGDRYFIGLCDFPDIWEVDKQMMLDHCG